MTTKRIEAGTGSALVRLAAAKSTKTPPNARVHRNEPSAREARPRARRNVLHGWRLLAGPLVVQVLQSGYDVPTHWPSAFVLSRYRRPDGEAAPICEETA